MQRAGEMCNAGTLHATCKRIPYIYFLMPVRKSCHWSHWKWIRYLILVVFLCSSIADKTLGQNLVPNYSFEDHTTCPCFGCGGNGPMMCPPWFSIGSNDYFHECSTFWPYGVPNNVFGGQFARTGAAYIGGHSQGALREYAQVQLLDTLEAGHCYKVGFYLNLGDNQCGSDHFGALLSSTAITTPLGMIPNVDLNGFLFTDTINWVFIFDYIVANGDEAYITLGNFYSDAETTVEVPCSIPTQTSYYFVEDVIVEEVMEEDIVVDIDGPIDACDSFEIVPIVQPNGEDILYLWSDGSRDPTLTVYTSGTYAVTVHYGCNVDMASVDVYIHNAPPVVLQLDDLTMCAGETYDISLDPDLGEYTWQDGSHSSDYTISGTGQYQVTLDDGCDLTTDGIDVLVVEPPEPISLGPDTFLCPGQEIIYAFDPAMGDYVWQDGSTDASYQIDVEGSYSYTVTNICGTYTDAIDVVELTIPSFDMGPDTTLLCAGQIIDITLDPALGSFHWQDGNNSPLYAIDTAGTYALTVTNGCGSETDQMVVDFKPPPLIQFGPDKTACLGDTLLLDGGMNTGSYLWQDGSTSTVFEVTTAGQYALTITNTCGTDSDTVAVAFLAPPTQPDLGPDINVCPGEEVVLSINLPGVAILWNDMSTSDTLLVDTAGTYFVQVSNICGLSSDTIMVSDSGEPPSLTLPADFSLCQGDTAQLDPGITGVQYLWNDGSQLALQSISSPGQYALTVSNSCGTDSDTINVSDGGPLPFVSLGLDTAICSGTSITLTPVSSHLDTWLWPDGSVMPSYATAVAGQVFVMATNGCGVAYDTIQIDLLPAIPSFSLGPDTSLCIGDTLSWTIAIPDVDILWQDGSVLQSFEAVAPGEVHAMISNSCGTYADTLMVSLLPQIPLLELGPDQPICPGETLVIDPGISDVSYLWQDGSTGSTMSVTQDATITLLITNACGAASDTLGIYESTDGPQVNLGPDQLACAGDSVLLETNLSGVAYTWQDGSTGESYLATASGWYVVTVSNSCGSDIDSVEVEISGVPPVVSFGADTVLCEGTTLLLTFTPDPITTWHWQDGSGASQQLVQTPGLYTLMAVNRCGNDTDSIDVSYMQAPEPFDLGPDTVLCSGASMVLSAPVTTDAYVWQDGSTLPDILVTTADTYILEVNNLCGKQTDTVHVGIDTFIPEVQLGPDTVICAGDKLSLDVTQAITSTYEWNTGDQTPTISVLTPGVYAVTVFTPCQSASDDIEILEKLDCEEEEELSTSVYIPNIFSPNGDQINDDFGISFGPDLNLQAIQGSIYDRWGNGIFQSDKIPFSWDGTRQGLLMAPGVYVYVLRVTYTVDGKVVEQTFSGEMTLVR